MLRKLLNGFILILALFSIVSCTDDEEIKKVDVSLKCSLKEDIFKGGELSDIMIELKNNSTGKISKKVYTEGKSISIDEGLYDITIFAKVSFSTEVPDVKEDNKQLLGANAIKTQKVRGVLYQIALHGQKKNLDVDLYTFHSSEGFVLSEIYFSGSKTPENKIYRSDAYFEIYNNSSEVLYADGLCIGESAFATTIKQDYKQDKTNILIKDIINKNVVVKAIYQIPGSGKDYPVKPGECILIADMAQNHKDKNSKSVDLSNADFEWFDKDNKNRDTDNPEVPNMNKIYCYTETIWNLNSNGQNSYILFRLDKKESDFLAANKFDYYYMFEHPRLPKPIRKPFLGYTVNNSLIMDAVNITTPSRFKWLVINESLDMGYTHSGDGDASRYGKSVQRKVSYINEKGRKVLMDTNNSTVDFNPTVVPSPEYIK